MVDKNQEYLKTPIPFNRPYLTSKEIENIQEAHARGQLAGDGIFTKKCQRWIEKRLNCKKTLLTHSCTGALEMAAILTGIKSGEEVITPSYTFVSTANAFVLRGAVPVFVDVRKDTLNIDEKKIEKAITEKTRVITVVHYAGVACEMDKIMKIARKYKLLVVEDAAQALLARYKSRYLGTIGDFGAISFHETKNIISGEGGALLINRKKYIERAEIVWEKGTNRKKFYRGEIDKYSWVDIGSSYLPSEIVAAFLSAQLGHANEINKRRIFIWNKYYDSFGELEKNGYVGRPIIPNYATHNAHLFYLITRSLGERDALMSYLKKNGVLSVFHYVPLHSSKAGKKFGRISGKLKVTDEYSCRLLRLPMFYDLSNENVDTVIDLVYKFYEEKN